MAEQGEMRRWDPSPLQEAKYRTHDVLEGIGSFAEEHNIPLLRALGDRQYTRGVAERMTGLSEFIPGYGDVQGAREGAHLIGEGHPLLGSAVLGASMFAIPGTAPAKRALRNLVERKIQSLSDELHGFRRLGGRGRGPWEGPPPSVQRVEEDLAAHQQFSDELDSHMVDDSNLPQYGPPHPGRAPVRDPEDFLETAGGQVHKGELPGLFVETPYGYVNKGSQGHNIARATDTTDLTHDLTLRPTDEIDRIKSDLNVDDARANLDSATARVHRLTQQLKDARATKHRELIRSTETKYPPPTGHQVHELEEALKTSQANIKQYQDTLATALNNPTTIRADLDVVERKIGQLSEQIRDSIKVGIESSDHWEREFAEKLKRQLRKALKERDRLAAALKSASPSLSSSPAPRRPQQLPLEFNRGGRVTLMPLKYSYNA